MSALPLVLATGAATPRALSNLSARLAPLSARLPSGLSALNSQLSAFRLPA